MMIFCYFYLTCYYQSQAQGMKICHFMSRAGGLDQTYMVMFLGWQAFKKNVYLIWPLAAGRQKRFESWLPDFLGSFGQFFVNSSNSKKGINLIFFSNCRYFFSLQNKKKFILIAVFFIVIYPVFFTENGIVSKFQIEKYL